MAKRTISPFKKAWTIITSRFKREKEEEFVRLRRALCKDCPLNSLNKERLSLFDKLRKYPSDFYSWITGFEDVLGICTHEYCGCSIAAKSNIEDEMCPEDKWESVFIPQNSKKKAR